MDREQVVDGTEYYVITSGPMRQEPSREFFVARSCQVAGEETVTVAGGIFNTVKTVCRDKTTNEVVYEMWYAPEAKHWVKEWTCFSWACWSARSWP